MSFSSLVIGRSLSQFNLDQYGHASKRASYRNEVEKIVKKLNESVGEHQWRGMKKRRELQTIENERVVVTNEYVWKKVVATAAAKRSFSRWMEQHCNVFSMDHTFIHSSDDQYGIEGGLEPLEE